MKRYSLYGSNGYRVDNIFGEWIKYEDYLKDSNVAHSLLAGVRALITASNNLIDVSQKTGAWGLVCDEEILFEKALKKVSEHFR